MQGGGDTEESDGLKAFEAAHDHEQRGEHEAAIVAYRRSIRLGFSSSVVSLANLLTKLDGPHTAEGLRLYRRGVRAGDETCAWNLAMHYRMQGNRRRYFHWLKVAADMGEQEAFHVVGMVQRIRARGKVAPMLFLECVDDIYVRGVLQDFLSGEMSRDQVVNWCGLVIRGEAAMSAIRGRRVADVVEELADPARRLTKVRARELLFKLG